MATQTVFLANPAGTKATYVGNPPNDRYIISDNDGNDTITLGSGADQLGLGNGNNTLTLGNGSDQIDLGDGNNTMTLGNGADQIITGNGGNTITTGTGNSQIVVGDGNNTITVGTGSNAVVLGAGLDSVTTGAGHNVVAVSGATVTGDTLKGALTSGDGTTNRLVLSDHGTMNPVNVSGFASWKLASDGPNVLTLSVANFARLPGGRITINDGNSGNTITASTLPPMDKIVVHAGAGADTLRGGSGNDIFYAGGKTTMTGGLGANQFTFAHIGANRITDFGASASNEIVLRNSGFNLGADQGMGTGTPQHLAASVFVANSTGAFTNTGQRFAYNTTTGALSYSAHGSGSAGSRVVVLAGHPTLAAGLAGHVFFTA